MSNFVLLKRIEEANETGLLSFKTTTNISPQLYEKTLKSELNELLPGTDLSGLTIKTIKKNLNVYEYSVQMTMKVNKKKVMYFSDKIEKGIYDVFIQNGEYHAQKRAIPEISSQMASFTLTIS